MVLSQGFANKNLFKSFIFYFQKITLALNKLYIARDLTKKHETDTNNTQIVAYTKCWHVYRTHRGKKIIQNPINSDKLDGQNRCAIAVYRTSRVPNHSEWY